MTEERWAHSSSAELRDEAAARALIYALGDETTALKRLGFPLADAAQRAKCGPIARRIFDSPGVKAKLASERAMLEERKSALVARAVAAALCDDYDTSIRAFTIVAKIAGWVPDKNPAPVDVPADSKILNLGEAVREAREERNDPPAEPDNDDFIADVLPETDGNALASVLAELDGDRSAAPGRSWRRS